MLKKFSSKKKSLCVLMATAVLCCSCGQTSQDGILVNGKAVQKDKTAAVYAESIIETHDDVSSKYKDLANTVIRITKGGDYEITGTAENTQIRVSAPQEEVRLILNNANISCATAPAIYIEDAADPQEIGQAGVTLVLANTSGSLILLST